MANSVFDTSYNFSALSKAARENNADQVRDLLRSGRYTVRGCDNNGWTAVHHAADLGSLEALKALGDFSIESTGNYCDLETRTHEGETPVFLACKRSELPCLKYLVEIGASVRGNQGPAFLKQTPLHAACNLQGTYFNEINSNPDRAEPKEEPWEPSCSERALPVIQFLIEGCNMTKNDINAVDAERNTPLMELLYNFQNEVPSHSVFQFMSRNVYEGVQYLLRHGADPTVINSERATALHIATFSRYLHIKGTWMFEYNYRTLKELILNMTSKYPAAVTKKLINYRDNERRTALQFLLMKNTSKNESTSEFREKKRDILRLILENGAEPSYGDLQFLFCGDIGLDGLKLFLDNEALGLKELLLDGLRKSKCYYRKSDLPAPFLKVIRNQYLDRHEKMEWLDYLFTKFHPDECSYYEKRGRSMYSAFKSSSKLMTPLAGIIQGCKLLQPDFPSEPRNEDSTEESEGEPDFEDADPMDPVTLVKKFVEHGSSVNSIVVKNGGRSKPGRKMETVHPLYVLKTCACTKEWSQVARYLGEKGSVFMDTNISYLDSSNFTGSLLEDTPLCYLLLLTECGILKPEMFMDSSPLYMDRELALSGNDYVMYLAIMGTELGKRFQRSFANCEPVASLAEPLQLNLTNVPRLQVLARAAVRDCMHESHPNKNMNVLINEFDDAVVPHILKNEYLKMKDLSKRYPIEKMRNCGLKFCKKLQD